MADSVLGFLRGLAARISHPDGKPYCAACGDLDPAAGDGACPHLQARALLGTLAEPPDLAAMEQRAAAVLRLAPGWDQTELAFGDGEHGRGLYSADDDGSLRNGLISIDDVQTDPADEFCEQVVARWNAALPSARDVRTLLAYHLRARTALEDAAPDLRAIRERAAADDDFAKYQSAGGVSAPEWRAELIRDRAALLGLVDLLALTVAKVEQERDQAAIASLQRLEAAVARVEQRHAVEAERDAALKSAAAWEIQAQDAADRARRLEERLAESEEARRKAVALAIEAQTQGAAVARRERGEGGDE